MFYTNVGIGNPFTQRYILEGREVVPFEGSEEAWLKRMFESHRQNLLWSDTIQKPRTLMIATMFTGASLRAEGKDVFDTDLSFSYLPTTKIEKLRTYETYEEAEVGHRKQVKRIIRRIEEFQRKRRASGGRIVDVGAAGPRLHADPDFNKWFEVNCADDWEFVGDLTLGPHFKFRKVADAMHFKMRWL